MLTYLTNPWSHDTDGDTLGDADEINIHGTNPLLKDGDGDGLDDAAELNIHQTDPNLADSDGDGINDKSEIMQGTDANNAASRPAFESVEVKGDGAQGVRKTQQITLTLPAGEKNYLVVIAASSEEYPDYTGFQSPYDDVVDWKITPAGGTVVQGSAHVNDLHEDWEESEAEGTSYLGLTPVAIVATEVIQGKASGTTSVQIELGATNVSDSALPTTLAAAVILPVIDLIIHKPGPDGTAIPETSETIADLLVLPVNDNFDERRREEGRLKPDRGDDVIDLSKDRDYLRLTLRVDPSRVTGTAALKFRSPSGVLASPVFAGKFHSADGQTKISENQDFTVDLANPSGPLAGINTPQGVTLLLEGVQPLEDAVLVLKQEQNGIVLAQDEVHFHVVNVDFADTPGPGALDDDDESPEIPQRWAMMVPLSGDTESVGSGEVKVKVEPASLASKVKISWATPEPPSTFELLTLSQGEHTLTIDGSAHALDNALKVEWLPSQQVIDGLKVDFLARRPRDSAQKVKIALWRIQDTESSQIPAAPYTQAEILAFLQQTWTAQANVQFEVVQDWQLEEVDYDLNDDGALSIQNNQEELLKIARTASGADIDVYLVKSMTDVVARALAGDIAVAPTSVFIAESAKGGIASPLSALAQEVGHVLGIPEDYDDPEDAGNVMSDPQVHGSTQVRKKDWRKANDPEN